MAARFSETAQAGKPHKDVSYYNCTLVTKKHIVLEVYFHESITIFQFYDTIIILRFYVIYMNVLMYKHSCYIPPCLRDYMVMVNRQVRGCGGNVK